MNKETSKRKERSPHSTTSVLANVSQKTTERNWKTHGVFTVIPMTTAMKGMREASVKNIIIENIIR
jgi:hypothetical protein